MSQDGLFVREDGDGASCYVLLHGFGTTHESFGLVRERLTDEARVLSVDLPGHGGSLDVQGTSARAAAEAVAAVIRARAEGPVHLAGHSLGGAVATLLSLSSPELVASLTLLAPGGFGPEINHRLLARYAVARSREELLAVLEAMSGWNHTITDAVLDGYVQMRAVPGQVEKLQPLAAGMARDGQQGFIPREKLAALSMPTALCWGLQDCVLPSRQAEGLPEQFMVHLLADTGHMLPFERPGELSEILRRHGR